MFSEVSDCPEFVVGEDADGTTPKLINAQAEQGPAITLAQSEFGTVTASFGGFLVKVIHAFRFDALTPCDIQDPQAPTSISPQCSNSHPIEDRHRS